MKHFCWDTEEEKLLELYEKYYLMNNIIHIKVIVE